MVRGVGVRWRCPSHGPNDPDAPHIRFIYGDITEGLRAEDLPTLANAWASMWEGELHFCTRGEQGDVHMACGLRCRASAVPLGDPAAEDPADHWTTSFRRYTFKADKTTCSGCVDAIRKMLEAGIAVPSASAEVWGL